MDTVGGLRECVFFICLFIALEPGSQWCPHGTSEETGAQRELRNSTHREHL